MTEPCTYIIFGATGNLSREKLMPALYHLEVAGRLPPGTIILAIGRRPWNHDQWIAEVRDMLVTKLRKANQELDETLFAERFQARLHYFEGDLTKSAMYQGLQNRLTTDPLFPPNMAFYMAIPPDQFGTTVEHLSTVGLLKEEANVWRRVVVEKPFGSDLESAHNLQRQLSKHLHENQIYRIDHYLGKATVQNVLVFRFANLMLEPLWNRHYIDHIQISHSETVGVGSRANYYDSAGSLRDMIQSHLLQVLSLVAMEPPVSMEAEALRDEKVKVLKSIRPIPLNAVHAHAVRAQYTADTLQGQKVKGYLQEDNVPKNSVTETYAAMKLFIDNWRWKGVPFYLRTGKRLATSQSMVGICFKQPPQQFFKPSQLQQMRPNWILLGIQPKECLKAELTVKESGLEMNTRPLSLDASLPHNEEDLKDAYQGLLLDIIEGDRSLFLRQDEVESAWQVVDPILRVWATERDYIPTYLAGSWGPKESQRLFEREDQTWRHSMFINE